MSSNCEAAWEATLAAREAKLAVWEAKLAVWEATPQRTTVFGGDDALYTIMAHITGELLQDDDRSPVQKQQSGLSGAPVSFPAIISQGCTIELSKKRSEHRCMVSLKTSKRPRDNTDRRSTKRRRASSKNGQVSCSVGLPPDLRLDTSVRWVGSKKPEEVQPAKPTVDTKKVDIHPWVTARRPSARKAVSSKTKKNMRRLRQAATTVRGFGHSL